MLVARRRVAKPRAATQLDGLLCRQRPRSAATSFRDGPSSTTSPHDLRRRSSTDQVSRTELLRGRAASDDDDGRVASYGATSRRRRCGSSASPGRAARRRRVVYESIRPPGTRARFSRGRAEAAPLVVGGESSPSRFIALGVFDCPPTTASASEVIV